MRKGGRQLLPNPKAMLSSYHGLLGEESLEVVGAQPLVVKS